MMKKIYFAHASAMDYSALYNSVRASKLNEENRIVLPHEGLMVGEQFNSKVYFKFCDCVIADVSVPSIGVGIELGWANDKHVDIIIVYKKGSNVSESLHEVSSTFIEYEDTDNLMLLLEEVLK